MNSTVEVMDYLYNYFIEDGFYIETDSKEVFVKTVFRILGYTKNDDRLYLYFLFVYSIGNKISYNCLKHDTAFIIDQMIKLYEEFNINPINYLIGLEISVIRGFVEKVGNPDLFYLLYHEYNETFHHDCDGNVWIIQNYGKSINDYFLIMGKYGRWCSHCVKDCLDNFQDNITLQQIPNCHTIINLFKNIMFCDQYYFECIIKVFDINCLSGILNNSMFEEFVTRENLIIIYAIHGLDYFNKIIMNLTCNYSCSHNVIELLRSIHYNPFNVKFADKFLIEYENENLYNCFNPDNEKHSFTRLCAYYYYNFDNKRAELSRNEYKNIIDDPFKLFDLIYYLKHRLTILNRKIEEDHLPLRPFRYELGYVMTKIFKKMFEIDEFIFKRIFITTTKSARK